jgi:hypothetical protein
MQHEVAVKPESQFVPAKRLRSNPAYRLYAVQGQVGEIKVAALEHVYAF